jgi:hypothetical protein|nr:MAG TPA: hypothetical protein [Caudoviricetes sp.]
MKRLLSGMMRTLGHMNRRESIRCVFLCSVVVSVYIWGSYRSKKDLVSSSCR